MDWGHLAARFHRLFKPVLLEAGRFLWTGGILPPDLPSWKLGCGSGTLPLHTTCRQIIILLPLLTIVLYLLCLSIFSYIIYSKIKMQLTSYIPIKILFHPKLPFSIQNLICFFSRKRLPTMNNFW